MNDRTRRAVNGIELDVIEAGEPGNPAVVLCHGFPESSHSWRHQVGPLAAAGYHVLAPDQRGYGRSSAPRDVAAYGVEHLAADLLGLLDATGHDDAVFVGHDWGALLVWDLARLHPSRVRAVINVSVPYTEWPAPPTDVFRSLSGDRFFYILYFQPVGPAERELEADVERTMRTILWAASGDGFPDVMPEPLPADGTGFLDSMTSSGPVPEALPAWLTSDDLAAYVDAFEASGFFGPVSWYRNLDANHAVVKDLPAAVDADVVHRRHAGHGDRRPSRLRRGDGSPPAEPSRHGAHRGCRPLDPAGGARRLQRGTAGGTGRARRVRRRGVSLSGRTHGVCHPRSTTLFVGGQCPSRL